MHVYDVFKTYAYTYISMKMDPNGNIPPSTTMMLGSMNLKNNTTTISQATQRQNVM